MQIVQSNDVGLVCVDASSMNISWNESLLGELSSLVVESSYE